MSFAHRAIRGVTYTLSCLPAAGAVRHSLARDLRFPGRPVSWSQTHVTFSALFLRSRSKVRAPDCHSAQRCLCGRGHASPTTVAPQSLPLLRPGQQKALKALPSVGGTRARLSALDGKSFRARCGIVPRFHPMAQPLCPTNFDCQRAGYRRRHVAANKMQTWTTATRSPGHPNSTTSRTYPRTIEAPTTTAASP